MADPDSPADNREAPTRLMLVLGAIWPSFRRTVRALFSALGLPVFLLAAISAAKYFGVWGFLDLGGLAERVVEWQALGLDKLSEMAARFGFSLPPVLVDAALIYLSVGNTVARAEKDDLVSVSGIEESRWSLLGEFFRRGRIDSLLLAIPRVLRDGFVRLFWPLMAVYRLGTPFVVDGPGPNGDDISTSVRRDELKAFAAMVTGSLGTWKGQAVYDFRQILTWHFVFVALGGYLTGRVLSLLA